MKFFQNLSYKTLFAILFFALAGIVFFIKIGGKTNKVSAAWWDEMWHYRKAISITNSSGSNLTDFQVSVSIGTSQLIADGKMQTDCDDIRITDINGNLLPYWIEENNPGCNSASGDTKIWLKATTLPTSGSTVYLYYGNQSADNNENGDNVFEFFDDFSTNLNKWINVSNSNWNVSSGILNITPSSNDNYLVANQSIGISGFTIEGRIRANSSSSSHIGFIWHANTSTGTSHRNDQIYLRPHSYNTTSNAQPGYFNGGLNTFSNSTGLFNYNTWYTIKVEVPTSNSVKYYRDDVNENNFANQQYQTNTYTGVVAHAGTNVQWDNFRVRKYVSSTPTTSPQSEESGGGPIAYWKFDDIYNGYTALEYITINNDLTNGYLNSINTNTAYNNATKLEFTVKSTDSTSSMVLVSAYSGTTTRNYPCILGSTSYIAPSSFTTSTLTPSNITRSQISDGTIRTFTLDFTSSSSYPISFGSWADGTWSRTISWYSFKIWNGSTMIKNFVPVKRISDNTLGFYDTINDTFYPNAGTGTFTAGPEITYDSAGTNNGTLGTGNSAPTWTDESQCISGKCLSFDGSNIITINNAKIFNSTTYTVSAWVKINSIPSLQYLISFANDGLPKMELSHGTYPLFYLNSSTNDYYRYGNKDIKDNNWHNIQFVFDDTNHYIKIYIDGKDTTGVGPNGNEAIITSIWKIGSGVNGLIDELKIYPYARTADQIKLDYNSRGSLSGSSVNLGVQSNTAPSLKSSLVAYYKFDEGSGVTAYDSSGNNKNATITESTWSNSGKFNKAISLGSTNAIITSNAIYNNSQTFTLSAHIYPTETSGDFKTVIGTSYGNNANSALVIRNNNICFHDYYTGSVDTNICTTNNPIILNQWQYISLTYDNGTINFYYNGGKNSNGNFTKSNTTGAVIIGRGTSFTGSRNFLGLIDEVKIYNRALTDEEVKQDYNAGSAIQFGSTSQSIGGTTTSLDYCIPGDTSYCAPPIAEWKMDEGVGTSIVDTSGNNYTSTFIGTPTWNQGKIGKSITFNGSNNAIQLSGPATSPHETLSSWVYIDSSSPNGDIVGNCHTNANQHYGFTLYLDGNNLRAKAATNADTYFFDNVYYDISSFKDKWIHLSMVWDNLGTGTGGCDTNVKLLINGQIVDEATHNVSSGGYNCTYPYPYPFSMGGTTVNSLTRTTKVKLDQVRVYNYARTPAQIAYDYNKGGPVGWWKFDECQGNIAYDWSGIGNTGVISIGASGTQNSLGTCATGTSAAWTNGATGKINSSLNFDGNDDIMTAPINIGGSNATFSFWIKNPAQGTGSYLLRSNAGTRTYININSSSTAVSFLKGYPTSVSIGSATINPNEWNHILLEWWTDDTGLMHALPYVNGKAIGIGTTFDGADNSTVVSIGCFSENNSCTSGQFDDLRVYNYALTSEQVKTVYNNGAINFQ